MELRQSSGMHPDVVTFSTAIHAGSNAAWQEALLVLQNLSRGSLEADEFPFFVFLSSGCFVDFWECNPAEDMWRQILSSAMQP